MAGVISGNTWTHKGISLLWAPEMLSDICEINQVQSIRQFLSYYQTEWPEELHSAEGYAMVVAGLETILDSMNPENLNEWLEKTFYKALLSFQQAYEGQCGLIFWLPDGQKRFVHNMTDDLFYWRLSGEHYGQMIPLSKCLWNGAAVDAKLIAKNAMINDVSSRECLGLFHPRIS